MSTWRSTPLPNSQRHTRMPASAISAAMARNGKTIEVSRFTIDLTHGDLTGIVNGNPAVRVPLFRLDLSHAGLAVGRHLVKARGIVLTLTSVAARQQTPEQFGCLAPDHSNRRG
jgi:hypothetical protein